jgi:CheY-like chemotaxis protein
MINVLLVDDNPYDRELIAIMLERAGYEIRQARDGREAVAILDIGPVPDIVITDLTMPLMDGPALIRRLRSHPPTADLPILVVSGDADSHAADAIAPLVGTVLDKESVAKTLLPALQRFEMAS